MGYDNVTIESQYQVRPFFRNSYMCRPHIMVKMIGYMNEAIDAALTSDISQMLEQNAKYGSSKLKRKRKKAARKIFDKSYYEFHPFVFERLPVFYAYNMKYSIWFYQ